MKFSGHMPSLLNCQKGELKKGRVCIIFIIKYS